MQSPKAGSRRRRIAPQGRLSNWMLAAVAGAITVAILAARALG
ncbi:MAG: hypothetical protein OEU94_06780 [Aquincola sp.]|nr:hypothetical protein [Aquincola sp.]MDH4287223.1 hypothetical protein [Aquincola sp.]MDH5330265.1 hypothetical protein [Aquincola sp.]